MKELKRFKEFLNEDLEEGVFDTLAAKLFKDTPKEDPTPEDVPSEPKLPEWVLMRFTDGPRAGLHTVFEMEKFKKNMKAKHDWINSPSDYLEILGKIPNARFGGIPASLGKEIFAIQQKDKSKTNLLKMGLDRKKVMDLVDKLVKPVKGNLALPMLNVNSLADLKGKEATAKVSDDELKRSVAADEEGIEEALQLVHVYDKDGKISGTGSVEKIEGDKTVVRFDGSTVKRFPSDRVKPVKEAVLFKDRSQDFQLDVIAQQMFRSNFRELDIDQQEDVRDKLESMDLNETRDPEVYAMADELVGYLGEKGFVEAILAAMSTDDARLYLSAIMRDYDLGGMEMNEEMDINEKAKVFFLQMLKRGEIDTLPTNPKEEYIRMMMKR